MTIDMNAFKEILEKQKGDLEHELKSHGRMLGESGDWIATPAEHDNVNADPNEVADRVEDFEVNVATLETLESQYSDVVRALGKMTDGTYGTCEVDGETIEEDRLKANPSARTCIEHMNEALPK